MANIRNISEIHPILGFTEFSSHWKPYLENLHVCMIDAHAMRATAFSYGYETPLGKPGMAQAYLPSLQEFGHKASAQQVCGCGGVLSVLLQEKKEEDFKDKDAQTSYDRHIVHRTPLIQGIQ